MNKKQSIFSRMIAALFCALLLFLIAGCEKDSLNKDRIAHEITERQKQFLVEREDLNKKEKDLVEGLNRMIDEYNRSQDKDASLLQNIDRAKSQVYEVEKEFDKSTTDYVLYLEKKLAEVLGNKFIPLKVEDRQDYKDTLK